MKFKKNGITIKTFGGLANRMRAIDSAWLLANKYNYPLTIIWEKSFELNCSFSKLFENIEGATLVEYYLSKNRKRIKDLSRNLLHKISINTPFGYTAYYSDEEILKMNRENFDFNQIVKDNLIYIYTVNRFYSDSNSLKLFRPIQEIQQKIDSITNQFKEATIGIHIRRTDNENAIKYSPIVSFIEIMQNEIAINNNILFYLATDSPDVENELKKQFPGRIITIEKTLDRDSEKGIQDALIDLYCLSNTNKIIGSYFSSFSEVASQINNIKLELVYKN